MNEERSICERDPSKDKGLAYDMHAYLNEQFKNLSDSCTPEETQEIAVQYLQEQKLKAGEAVISHVEEISNAKEEALIIFFQDKTMLYFGFTEEGLLLKCGNYTTVETALVKAKRTLQ